MPFDDAIAVSAPSSDGSIAETIAALPGESRRLLLLRYDVGLKVAEIARLTGKSYHAVYKGTERALPKSFRKEASTYEADRRP